MSDVQGNQESLIQGAQVQIEQGQLEEIVRWLDEELRRSLSDRQGLDTKILEWDRLYEAEPKETVKSFPWEGASNLVVPTIATAVESITARLMDAVFGAHDIWNGKAKSPQWVELVDPITRWMNWVGTNVMGMYKLCQRWFLSMVKYGTGVVKLPWVEKFRTVRYMDANGGMVNERIKIHSGPKPEVVRIEDFHFSPDAITSQDIQNCEWVAQRSVRTFKYLKELENSGVYLNVDELKAHKRTFGTETEEQVEATTGVQPSERNDYEIWEVWCSYDVTGNGDLAELVITFHLDTGTVLRAVYNFYRHQERPFHVIRYMVRENSLLGIGICQMLEDTQNEITAIHNQRLDNATLANTKMWKKRQGANIDADDVYPGGMVTVPEMNDIEPMDMGYQHPSMLQEELHSNSIGEKRTGVSDYTVGRESAAIGSRATATSTLALIREGNKRFKMAIKEIREVLAEIAQQVIALYQQFAPDNTVMYELFSPEEAQYIKKYFALPMENTRNNIQIDVPALSETSNKEIQQQSYLMLLQVTQQLYGSLMQAFQVALSPQAPPQVQQLAAQGAQTGSKLFQRILEAFDIQDAENFTPDVNQMLGIGSTMEQMLGSMNEMSQLTGGIDGSQQTFNGPGAGNPEGLGAGGEQSAMEGLNQGAGQPAGQGIPPALG